MRQIAGEQTFQAPCHVLCRHGVAGRELGVGPQVEADRFPILADFPTFGKAGLDAAIFGRKHDQRVVDIIQNLHRLAAGNGGWIKGQDIAHGRGDDELVLRRFGKDAERHGADQQCTEGCGCKKMSHFSSHTAGSYGLPRFDPRACSSTGFV
ncbi:hypothetical protein D3C87_1378430 [compost metagenome]